MVRWRDADGKQRTKSFLTHEEARAHDARMTVKPQRQSRLTVRTWFDEWVKTHGVVWATSTRTVRVDQANRMVLPKLGDVPLGDLSKPMLRDWRLALLEQGRPPGQVNDAVNIVRAMLTAAIEDEQLDTNVAAKLKALPEQKPLIRPLAPTEIERLRLAVPERWRIAISLMAYAGLRPEEVWALPWENVSKHSLTVNQAYTYGQHKGPKVYGQERVIPLSRPLAADLGPDRPSGLVCSAAEGGFVNHRNWLARVWRPARGALGLLATPYHLRHTYASLLLHEGVALPVVAYRLGHSRPTTTLDHYAHIIEEAELAPRTSLDRAVLDARRALGIHDVYQEQSSETADNPGFRTTKRFLQRRRRSTA